MSLSPVRVGIVGQGRSGWDIHGRSLRKLPEHFEVVAVADLIEERRQDALQAYECRTYGTFEELIADPDVELVVVSTFNYLHAPHAIAALEAGKHVLGEKPMAVCLADADRMIEAAERTGRVLSIFHQRRFEPTYRKIKELMESGIFGRILQIKIHSQGFGRRWDWQTSKAYGGGILRNNGVHFLDQALQLMHTQCPEGMAEPEVFCQMERALALGDAEDHVKLILRAPGAPLVDFELTSACAYPQDFWMVQGTQGTLTGTFTGLQWKYYNPAELEPRELSMEPTQGRTYNSDHIPWVEESWAPEPEETSFASWADAYYRALYLTLREGAPLVVPPRAARETIAVVERCGWNVRD